MEHRWGARVDIDVRVQLRCLDSVGPGNITNASLSGAFIRTRLTRPSTASTDVLLAGHPIAALVIRGSSEGLGVEWCDWKPQIISALLLTAHGTCFPLRSSARNLTDDARWSFVK